MRLAEVRGAGVNYFFSGWSCAGGSTTSINGSSASVVPLLLSMPLRKLLECL